MRITARVNGARASAAIGHAPERMRKLVGDAIGRGAEEVAREAKRRAPKAFSTLTNSILPVKIDDLHWQVRTGTNYARSVEEGRAPGRMPGAGLTEWVKFKTGLQGKELDRRTFIIARAIGRRGIKAQPYMQPALDAKEGRVFELVREAVGRGVREILP